MQIGLFFGPKNTWLIISHIRVSKCINKHTGSSFAIRLITICPLSILSLPIREYQADLGLFVLLAPLVALSLILDGPRHLDNFERLEARGIKE